MRRVFFVLLVLFAIALLQSQVVAEQQEDPDKPKQIEFDWNDTIDASDMIVARDVGFVQCKKYDLFKDSAPLLPDPHPMCFAPKDLDSYEGGKRKYPKQLGFPECWYDYSEAITHWDNMRKDFVKPQVLWESKVSHNLDISTHPLYKPRSYPPFFHFSTNEHERLFEELYGQVSTTKYCVEKDAFAVVSGTNQRYTGTYELAKIGFALFKDGHSSFEPHSEHQQDNLRFLTYLPYSEANQGIPGCVLFFDSESRKLSYFRGRAESKTVKLTLNLKFPHNIWGSPKDLPHKNPRRRIQGSQYSAAFPYVAVCERNFGLPRGLKVPEIIYDPVTGRNTNDNDVYHWYKEQTVEPDVRKTNHIVLNAATGESVLEFEDVSEIWMQKGGAVIPHVSFNGMWHLTGITWDGRSYNLPFASFIPKSAYSITLRFGRYLLVHSPETYTIIDLRTSEMFIFDIPRRPVSSKYSYLGYLANRYRISEPYDFDGAQVRNIALFDVKNPSEENAVTLAFKDFLDPTDPTLTSFVSGHSVFIYQKRKCYRFDMKELPK